MVDKLIAERQQAYIERVTRGDTGRVFAADLFRGHLPPGVAHPKIDSFLLALAATPYARGDALDAFAGSGVVGLCLLPRVSKLHFVDSSTASFDFITSEINAHPQRNRLSVERADCVPSKPVTFDTIVANPPYTDHAVRSPVDTICFDPGHKAFRRFVAALPRLLRAGGNTFISWASFAEPNLVARAAKEATLSCEIVATLQEPAGPGAVSCIIYSIYRLTHPVVSTDGAP